MPAPGGHARRCFTSAGSLQRFPAIRAEPFHRPRQIRVPRPGPMQRWRRGRIVEPGILVRNQHRDRRTDRLPHPHAVEKLGVIALDFLPATAPVPALATPKFRVDERLVDWHSRGHTLDQRDHRFAVRFAGGAVRKRGHIARILADFASSNKATPTRRPTSRLRGCDDSIDSAGRIARRFVRRGL